MGTDAVPGQAAEFSELVFKPGRLAQLGLPEMAYPVRPQAFAAAVLSGGELPFAEMLFGLQEKSGAEGGDWRALEPAIDRLAELITPDDRRQVVDVEGDSWWLELGPVALDGGIVTIQREAELIAAIAPRKDGRLRVACYRPLDAKSADYVLSLGLHPHPEHGVCMRANNWEYALDCSAATGNWYALERGEAHLSYWQAGIGVRQDGALDPHWHAMRQLACRQPARIAMELGVRYTLRDEP